MVMSLGGGSTTARGALVLLLVVASRDAAAQPIESDVQSGDVYAKAALVPKLSSAVHNYMAKPFKQALEFTEAAGRIGALDGEDRAKLSSIMYTQTLATGCGDPGNPFDMVYLGLETGTFVGYFSPSSYTYRPPTGTMADQLSWAPYTLESINGVCDATPGACDFSNATSPKIARKACTGDAAACAASDLSGGGLSDPWERLNADRSSCLAAGDCKFSAYGGRNWDGKVVAAACDRPAVDTTSACATVNISGVDTTADQVACESAGSCAYTPGTCTAVCTDTCCDGDLRVYITSDFKGEPLETTRWRVYDHRARPWYIQQKERYASTGEAFGWSGVYTFSTSGALGISATAMLHDSNGEPHGVAAIDYTLAIISQLVTDELISLRADLATTFAYVVERQGATAGTLMGSSTDSPTDLSSGSVVRLHATAASHPGAAISAEYLDSNGWPVVDGIFLSRGEVQVEVGTYSFEDNGLVWLIVVGQYTNCSATDVWDYGKCQTCEGGTEPADGVCVPCAEGYAGIGGACLACPAGTQPNTQKTSCDVCPNNQHYTSDGGCTECPFLTTVNQDPLTAADMPCVCEKGMFDISEAEVRGAFCFAREWVSDPFEDTDDYDHYQADKNEKGLQCSTCPPCMDCSNPGMIVLKPGWKTIDIGESNHSKETAIINRLKITADVMALRCPIEGACLGDTIENGTIKSRCATGYTGHLCAICADGYTTSLNGCEECSSESLMVIPVMVFGIILFSIFYAAFEHWFTEGGAAYTDVFFEVKRLVTPISKVLVTTSQIVGSIPLTMGVTFPPAMKALVNFLRIFALDVFVILRSNCLFGDSFYSKFASTFTIPIIVLALVFAYSSWKSSRYQLPDKDSMTEKQRKSLRDEYEGLAARGGPEDNEVTAADIAACCEDLGIEMTHEEIDTIIRDGDEDHSGALSFEQFLHEVYAGSGKFPDLVAAYDRRRHEQSVYAIISVVIFMLYPGVCQTAFAALRCRDLGEGVSTLEADYNVDCSSSDYLIFRFFAIFTIIMIPVGIPVGAFLILRRHEEKILAQDRDTLREFQTLVGDYEPQYYYWECVELGRKLALAGFIMFVAPGGPSQIAIAMSITFFFFALSMRCTPFAHPAHDTVKALSEVSVFIVLLSVLLMKPALVDKQQDTLGTATVAVMLIVGVLIIFFTAHAAKHIIGGIRSDIKGLDERAKAVENPLQVEDDDNDDED